MTYEQIPLFLAHAGAGKALIVVNYIAPAFTDINLDAKLPIAVINGNSGAVVAAAGKCARKE